MHISDEDLKYVGRQALDSDDPKERAKAILRVMRVQSKHKSTPGFEGIAKEVRRMRETADALDFIYEDELGTSVTIHLHRTDAQYSEHCLVHGVDHSCFRFYKTHCKDDGIEPQPDNDEWLASLPEEHRALVDDGSVAHAARAEQEARPLVTGRKRIRDLSGADLARVLAGNPWPLADADPQNGTSSST